MRMCIFLDTNHLHVSGVSAVRLDIRFPRGALPRNLHN